MYLKMSSGKIVAILSWSQCMKAFFPKKFDIKVSNGQTSFKYNLKIVNSGWVSIPVESDQCKSIWKCLFKYQGVHYVQFYKPTMTLK